MPSTSTYYKRKKQGLCIHCGGHIEKERKGMTECQKCADERNKLKREEWAFYKKKGICPVCHKNLLFGEEQNCPECRCKKEIRDNKYRARGSKR